MTTTPVTPLADDAVAHVPDALMMLMADHAAVERLFDRVDDASSHDERSMLPGRICRPLEVHATCEEELPDVAACGVLSDVRVVQAEEVEHPAATELMRRVEVLSPAQPRLRLSWLDLQFPGAALAAPRDELERRSGEPPRPGRDCGRKGGAQRAVYRREMPWAPARHPAIDDPLRKPGGHAA